MVPCTPLVMPPHTLPTSGLGTCESLSSSRHQDEALETDFNLLLKVPRHQGAARPLTVHQLSFGLKAILEPRYVAVSEVHGNIFLATFLNHEDMMYVVRRQPWAVQSQHILVELYDPRKTAREHQFLYMYANVKLYGIPRDIRTTQRITEILNLVGRPSDLDELNEANIHRDEAFALV